MLNDDDEDDNDEYDDEYDDILSPGWPRRYVRITAEDNNFETKLCAFISMVELRILRGNTSFSLRIRKESKCLKHGGLQGFHLPACQ